MEMKKQYIYILITLITIFLSCREEATYTNYTLKNNTEHKIELISLNTTFEIEDSILLLKHESKEYDFNVRGKGGSLSLFGYQYVEAVYDDTISIMHGDINIAVKRNLLEIASYEGGIVEEKSYYITYEYEYEFTEVDYQEALDAQ